MTQLLTDEEADFLLQRSPIQSTYHDLINLVREVEAAVLDRLSKQTVYKRGCDGTKIFAAPMPPVKQGPVAWWNPDEDDSGEAFHWDKGMTEEHCVPVFAAPVPPDPRIAELEAALLEQVDLTIQLRDQLRVEAARLDWLERAATTAAQHLDLNLTGKTLREAIDQSMASLDPSRE